jgi:hypothetical protein
VLEQGWGWAVRGTVVANLLLGGLGDIGKWIDSKRSPRGESVMEGEPSVGIVGMTPGRESTLSAGIEAK